MAVLPEKLASPEYEAAMVCEPGAKEAVLNEAVVTPPVVVTLAGPPALLPSITNCTVPLGVPVPAVTLTVAVNVTLCPNTVAPVKGLSVVLVVALVTVWVRAVAVLPAKLLSPV
jgi:hypothetical protein